MSARSVTYELEAKLKGGGRGLFRNLPVSWSASRMLIAANV